MHWPTLMLAPALALAGAPPAAALYKCTTADGGVVFQQTACFDGDGTELEAADAFGVRPIIAPPAAAKSTPPAAAAPRSAPPPGDASHGPPVGQTASGRPIYAGPRGGRYTISASGRKNYLPKPPEAASAVVSPPASPRQPATDRQIHTVPRGGCYTLSDSGRKNYLPHQHCPQK